MNKNMQTCGPTASTATGWLQGGQVDGGTGCPASPGHQGQFPGQGESGVGLLKLTTTYDNVDFTPRA